MDFFIWEFTELLGNGLLKERVRQSGESSGTSITDLTYFHFKFELFIDLFLKASNYSLVTGENCEPIRSIKSINYDSKCGQKIDCFSHFNSIEWTTSMSNVKSNSNANLIVN